MISHLNPVSLLATLFYIGRIPHVGGVVASLLAVLLAAIIHNIWGGTILIVATIAAFFIGLAVADNYVKSAGGPEDVVIDELVGMWLVLVLADALNYQFSFELYIAAFLSFSIFDIAKPWPIGGADKLLGGGFGVMMDDVLAGIYGFAGMATMLFFYTRLGWGG